MKIPSKFKQIIIEYMKLIHYDNFPKHENQWSAWSHWYSSCGLASTGKMAGFEFWWLNTNTTSSQINDTFLFHRVIKILTGGRILQISIAWCQIEAEIHSFPTLYGKGGMRGRCGKKNRHKTRFFWGHKSGSSHFRVASDPLFQRWCQFRYVPQKIWVKSFQMSYGHVR